MVILNTVMHVTLRYLRAKGHFVDGIDVFSAVNDVLDKLLQLILNFLELKPFISDRGLL